MLRTNKLRPEYLFAFLNSQVVVNQTSCLMTGNTLPRLQTEDVEDLLIPLPPEDVQSKVSIIIKDALAAKSKKESNILGIIHSIDSKISNKIGFEFPIDNKQKSYGIKVSVLENRLDPHFYLPKFSQLVENIVSKHNLKLGDIVEFSKETWNQKDGFKNDFPYIEISEIDLTDGKIKNVSSVPIGEAPSRAKMVVRENDIIVSTTRPHRGAISLIDKTKDGFIASTGFCVLRKLKTDAVSKEYLFYILRTQICLQQMLQRSSGGSYPAITAEELKNIYIPIPLKVIQQEIVDEIKKFIAEADKLKKEAETEFEKAKKEIEELILD